MQSVLKRLTFFGVLLFSLLVSLFDYSSESIALCMNIKEYDDDNDNSSNKTGPSTLSEIRTIIQDPAFQTAVAVGAGAATVISTSKTLREGMKKASSLPPVGRTLVLTTGMAAVAGVQITETIRAIDSNRVESESEKNQLDAAVRLKEIDKASLTQKSSDPEQSDKIPSVIESSEANHDFDFPELNSDVASFINQSISMTEFSCVLILSFLGFIFVLLIRPTLLQYLLSHKYVKIPHFITSLLTRIHQNKGVSRFDEFSIFLLVILMVPCLRFIYNTFFYIIKMSSIVGSPIFPSSFVDSGLLWSRLAFLLYGLLVLSLYFPAIYNFVLTRVLKKQEHPKLKQRNLLIIGVIIISLNLCIDYIFTLMVVNHKVF